MQRGRSSLSIVLLVLFLTVPVCASAEDEQKAPLQAKEILARMAKVYATCKTYRDTGVVKTLFILPQRQWTARKPFSTAFVRPDRFRYEFKDMIGGKVPTRYIVHAGPKGVRSWWTVTPGVKEEKSLAMALAKATGVSGGSAHTVPRLLMPSRIHPFALTDVADAERVPDERVHDRLCFRIDGKEPDGDPLILWIDKETFLVRRIETRHKLPEFSFVLTTTYGPAVNGEIPPKELAFDAPE